MVGVSSGLWSVPTEVNGRCQQRSIISVGRGRCQQGSMVGFSRGMWSVSAGVYGLCQKRSMVGVSGDL